MGSEGIRSVAFRHAALASERVRIGALLAVLAAMVLVLFVREAVAGSHASFQVLPASLLFLVLVFVYEGAMFRVVRRAVAADRLLPGWVWPLNLSVETLIPTIALVILTELAVIGPFRALVAPALLAYFIFIILSILRLSPLLSCLTGLLSTAGYLAVIGYTYARYGEARDDALGLAVYLTHATTILIGGLAAGGVAREVRKHVAAALREVEARRQVERMEHDLEIARNIQQGLLPGKPPEIEGFDIAGWNLPADETGGDFYDWMTLPDGRTAIVLGDVTGHGIGPALVTAACRAYGRASLPAGPDLETALDRIDGLLTEDLPTGKLVTFVAGIVDAGSSQVDLLSAGHGPLVLYLAAEDRFERFDAHGVPLGVGLGLGRDAPQRIDLGSGDMLVLVTDGFFEWEDPDGEQFGMERLEETLRRSRALSSEEIIAALYADVTAFADGTPQNDDLTAVIVKKS